MASNVTIGGATSPLNITGTQSGIPAAGTAAYNSYFVKSNSSVLYSGSGTIAPASASPNSTLIILANTVATVPGGYAAVLDTASGDTLTGGGSGTTYFLQNNGPRLGTVLNLTPGSTNVYALGADTINADAAAATVAGGANGVTVAGGSSSLFFVGGTGAVSVFAGSGSATMFGGTGSNGSVLTAGSGQNNVLIGGPGSGNQTLVAGTGTTTAYANGTGNTTMIAGSGNGTLYGSTGQGNELLATNPNGPGGKVLMNMNDAADTLLGGGGQATVYGGKGHDIYGFISGHAGGTIEVHGFKTTDTMIFAGYGNKPIAAEKVIGGNDFLTLKDGTQITIVGYHHTIFK